MDAPTFIAERRLASGGERATIQVTIEIADDLAQIAGRLESQGRAPALVARFLMRCLFTMFAESVELLPRRMFSAQLQENWAKDPAAFAPGVERLWRAPSSGGDREPDEARVFNGALFEDPVALPLDEEGLAILRRAAERDWANVEPSIFGALLERALDPKERHKLGAHFTPRAYVERLVRPTIEEPLRTKWESAKASARELRAEAKLEGAREVVRAFHTELCATRVLDPACGTGNFLYVTLDILKQIESEALALLASMGEEQAPSVRITPENVRGIEIKPWAKEIAELVLWIGYLQSHHRAHGKGAPPPAPALRDYGNIECRDAVLAWDKIELAHDENGMPISRWDGETTKTHPVTGAQVPDETATVPVYRYVNPRRAEWPKADFIVGNPPFLGAQRLRSALGDGYAEALWAAHRGAVPPSADLVMYWWAKAAMALVQKTTHQFGMITTNSITQGFNRRVVEAFVADESKTPIAILFAVPDHPWVIDGAAVRIAMTVASARNSHLGKLLTLSPGDEEGALPLRTAIGRIRSDLRIGADVSALQALRANQAIGGRGVQLMGGGFILSDAQRAELLASDPACADVVRPFRNGRDLAASPRDCFVIDFFGVSEPGARLKYPGGYQWLHDHVLPERQQNARAQYRALWWQFGENALATRRATSGLSRYIATVRTAKHRFFTFLPGDVVAESKLVVIGSDDAWLLGVCSSSIHTLFARQTGGWLGVGNDSTYNHADCFNKFPFPICTAAQSARVRALGEQLDAHRKARQSAWPELTITAMYNVLEKLRDGSKLTDKDQRIHDHGLVSILKRIHDDLDAAVFEAYGFPPDLTDEQILEKLVSLNAERAEEEKNGLVRWLRPDFQNPAGKQAAK